MKGDSKSWGVDRKQSFWNRLFKTNLVDRSIDRVRKKGDERLTIMVIPHKQAEVFSLQLNWSMILFLLGTLAVAVLFSGYGFYWQAKKARENYRVEKLHGANLGAALTVKSSIETSIDLKQDLLERMREIAVLVGYREQQLTALPGEDASIKSSRAALQAELLEETNLKPTDDYLPPIYAQRKFNHMLRQQSPLLLSLKHSINDGLGVYNSMPLGRAVIMQGYVQDTSQYGRRLNAITGVGWEMHTGMDTSAPWGTPVYATAAGTVHRVTYSKTGYGNVVVLRHDNGYYTLYAHLSAIHVSKGRKVKRGRHIGNVGRSGRSTGSHLHYEVRLNNSTKVDPLPYVCATDLRTKNCLKTNRKYDL